MNDDNINKELKSAAIYWRNLEKVRELLSSGGNPNLVVDNQGTLLHHTCSLEITKELLSHGARVNERNSYRETPLHSAITLGKNLELVRELLKHGADVNATNRKGNTPLNSAVKKSGDNAEIIKELLKHGADINIRNRECRLYDNHNTPLDNAAGNPIYAKLLIKFTLIKNFDRDYRKIINLTPYNEFRTYDELSNYLDDCVCEVVKMKTYLVKENLSLYELVTNSIEKHVLLDNQLSIKLASTDYSTHFPIYNDIILDNIRVFLKRADLLNNLSNMQIYTILSTSNQCAKITLNYDCVSNIAKYLYNDDLSKFIEAFQNSYNHDMLNRPNTILNDPCTSSYVKRPRLE